MSLPLSYVGDLNPPVEGATDTLCLGGVALSPPPLWSPRDDGRTEGLLAVPTGNGQAWPAVLQGVSPGVLARVTNPTSQCDWRTSGPFLKDPWNARNVPRCSTSH